MENKDEKKWAVAVHLSLFAGALVPLGGIVAPIAIWLLKRKESRYVDEQGKEVLNYMISNLFLGLGFVVCACVAGASPLLAPSSLTIPAVPLCVLALGVAFVLYRLVMPIVAAVKCSKGEDFRYPGVHRFLK